MRSPHGPEEHDELFLTIGRVKAFGTVAWEREGEFAVAFDERLDAHDLADLRQNVRASRGLPPDVKAALDDWVLGTR